MRVDEHRITATYLLASGRHGTLYLGSALDLWQRVRDHRGGMGSTFTRKHGVARLVWFERHVLVKDARDQEYAMKKWRREWKCNLIERDNPHWDDLFPTLLGDNPQRWAKLLPQVPFPKRF